MSSLSELLDEWREWNPFVLANAADCGTPETSTSAGSVFLVRVRSAVHELLSELDSDGRNLLRDGSMDDDGTLHEIADSSVPIYTHELWSTFVDLSAYNEDVDEYEPTDLNNAAGIALFVIAERLVGSLVDEGRDALVEDDSAAVERAALVGAEHGRNAAEFWNEYALGGRATGNLVERARWLLSGVEDCNPAVLDELPSADLSSEHADGFSLRDLCVECGTDEDGPAADECATAYEDGFTESVEAAVVRACTDVLIAAGIDPAADEDEDEDGPRPAVPETLSYLPIAVMDDGGTLCGPCVEDETNPVHSAGSADGWRVDAWTHSGDVDSFTSCDHCGRVLVERDEDEDE